MSILCRYLPVTFDLSSHDANCSIISSDGKILNIQQICRHEISCQIKIEMMSDAENVKQIENLCREYVRDQLQ